MCVLTPDDWELWREVRLRALADAPDAFGSTLAREQAYGEDDWREWLNEPAVVALEDGAAVACGALFANRPGYAAVVAMWVAPDLRGRGLSRRVLDVLVDWAGARGLRVELGVNRLNPVARAAYLAYGFAPTPRCHPLRDGSDKICDVLELDAPARVLARIEQYYDEVPRLEADARDAGPFTLFVRRGTGHPYYARPGLGRTAFEAEDIARVLDLQRTLGVPRALEWVDEVTPGLRAAVIEAGHRPRLHPLLVLGDLSPAPPMQPTASCSVLAADDPRLAEIFGAVSAGFAERDEVAIHEIGARAEAIAAGRLVIVGAFAPDGRAVGGGSTSPRGTVTELAGIAVLPRARRRGTGAALTRALVGAAHDAGCRTVFLSAADDAACRTYERIGFRRAATACVLEPDA